jgi:hypothetical protein
LAPLTNNDRPVNNLTGEKIPNGCAKSTNVVNGSLTAVAGNTANTLAASAAVYK